MREDETASRRIPGAIVVWQEMLSRPEDANKPLKEQEFAELRIEDWTNTSRSGFAVTEWRIRWSEAAQQFVWEDEQQEHWSALQTVKNRFEARLCSLRQQGFTNSDLDLF